MRTRDRARRSHRNHLQRCRDHRAGQAQDDGLAVADHLHVVLLGPMLERLAAEERVTGLRRGALRDRARLAEAGWSCVNADISLLAQAPGGRAARISGISVNWRIL